MAKKRKCKCCGRSFTPKSKEDRFCSAVCRTTGLFVGGGGDTTKPGKAVDTSKEESPKPMVRVKTGDDRFARVRAMFQLPASERWAVSKTFTKEEADYARRIARRMLAEEARLTKEVSWEGGDEEEVSPVLLDSVLSGDSDDGTL